MDSKNLTIGVLATTATILFVGLVLLHAIPSPAQASGMGACSRDYGLCLSVGRIQQGEQQVFVIDAAGSRMNAYSYDLSRKEIRLDQTISLEDMRRFVEGDRDRRDRTRKEP